MRFVRTGGIIAVTMAFTPHVAVAQERPATAITAPQEFPEPFTSIRGMRTLANGQLVISDTKEGKLLLVDFAGGTAKPLGRRGSGPQEYQQLGRVSAAQGGGAVVYDMRQNRFLQITAGGQTRDVAVVPVSDNVVFGSNGPDSYTPDSLGAPFGNFYNVVRLARDFETPLDSSRLVRFNPQGTRADTIIKFFAGATQPVEEGGRVVMRQPVAFSPADIWGVAPDGWVGVVRGKPFRIDWVSPTGKVTLGREIPYTPVVVTAAERDSIVEYTLNPPGGATGAFRSSGGATQARRLTPVAPIVLAQKPAFPSQIPVIDDAGQLWVERHQAQGAKTRRYDVLDRTGAVAGRYDLPAGSRLVHVDRGFLYAVRQDQDDLLHLQRFARR